MNRLVSRTYISDRYLSCCYKYHTVTDDVSLFQKAAGKDRPVLNDYSTVALVPPIFTMDVWRDIT